MLFTIEPYYRQLIFLLCKYLTFEFSQPQINQLIGIIFNQIHLLSFVYSQSTLSGISFKSILLVTRPYLFIENSLTKLIILIISTVIQQLIIFTMIAIIISNKNNDSTQFLDKHNSLIISICFFIYYMSEYFYTWSIEISLINIHNIIGLIISIISLIQLLFLIFLADFVYRRGLVFRVSTQLPLNYTVSSFLIKGLRIIQITLLYVIKNQQVNLNIQCCIILICELLLLYQILEVQIYSKITCILFEIVFISINISIVFETYIIQSPPADNLWILYGLLGIYLIYQIKINEQFTLETIHSHQLKYVFSIVESLNGNNQKDRLKMNQLIFEHQLMCQNQKCICHKQMNIKQKILQILQEKFESLVDLRSRNIENISLDLIQILYRKRQFVKAQQTMFKVLHSKDYFSQSNTFNISLTLTFLFEFIKIQIDKDVLIQMMEKMILINPNNKICADSLRQFAINENSDQYIQLKLLKCIQEKIGFYYYFIEHNGQNQGNALFYLKTVEILQEFRLELQERYSQFPTLSNQNILKFYLLEVLNDYVETFNLHKNKAYDDSKYQIFHDTFYNKLFAQSPSYITVEVTKEMDVEIVKQSKRASIQFYKIYGQKWKANSNQSLNPFLPEYVEKVHKHLIEQFLDEGTNKYYQQQNQAFLKLSERVMIPIDIMIGINYSNTSAFSFLTFFFESYDIRSFVVVNQNLEIINCSENISSQILVNNHSSSASYLFQKVIYPINNIIPEFDQLILEDNRYYFNQPIRLVSTKSPTFRYIDHLANLTIEKKFNNQYQCYLIIIDNIRINTFRSESKQETSIFQRKQTQEKSFVLQLERMNSDFEEQIEKQLPYYEIPDISIIKKMNGTIMNNDITLQVESKLQVTELLFDQDQTNQTKQKELKLFSPTDSINHNLLQINKQTFQNEIRDYQSGSSVTKIKRSKYFKKFQIVYSLCKSLQRHKKLFLINLLFILYIFLLIAQIISLLSLIYNVYSFIQDIKLLSIRYDVTEPLEAFTVSRFTTINYKEMVGRKAINATYSTQLQIFPRKAIHFAYTKLRDGLTEVLQRNEIDQIANVTEIPIMIYVNQNNTGAQKLVTMRSLITITLNYEYDFLIHIVNDTTQSFDSPYFYFSYKDYLVLKSVFDDLSNIVLDITLNRTYLEKQKWIYFFIPFNGLTFLLTSLLIILYKKHKNELNSKIQFITQLDPQIIQNEKQRMQYITTIIQTNFDYIKSYNFDIEIIDDELEKLSTSYKKQNYTKKQPIKKINHNSSLTGIILFLIHYILLFGFTIYLFLRFQVYFEKYERTAIFYQQLSDIGVDIPAIYSQKEVLFRAKAKYPFLNSTDINSTYAIIFNAVKSIETYQQKLLSLQHDNYLFDSELINYFSMLNSANLCEYQSDEMKQMTQTFCSSVMQGNLLHGFQQALIYILTFTNVQQSETSNFTIQPNSTLLELEGSTILSNIIEIMKNQFYDNLIDSAQSIIFYQEIFAFLFLVLETIFILIYFLVADKYNLKQFQCLKQSVYLYPRYTLIFDDSFFRNFGKLIKEVEIQS